MWVLNFHFKKLLCGLFFLSLVSSSIIYSQSIQLEWTPSTQQNIYSYKIYRSTNTNTNYVAVATVNHPTSTYVDNSVAYNTRYYYAATTVNQQGAESTMSNAVQIVTPAAYSLTFTANPVEGGNIAINPQKSVYVSGSSVTLTATPKAGFRFDHWSGDISGSSASVTMTMNANKNVTAHFTRIEYSLSLTINPANSGSISKNPNKTTYYAGEQVVLTASAMAGYRFDGWSGDVTGSETTKTIQMNANKSITANFSLSTVSITGNVSYVNSGIALSSTQVNLTGGRTSSDLADANGKYEFGSLNAGTNYSIFPQRNRVDCGSSIIMFDAALAARIAMNLATGVSEVSKVAADANGDGKVQMYDASLIAMMAVGLSSPSDSRVGEFGFYPKNRSYNQLNSTCSEQNFTATILGDVDGNWRPTGPLLKENEVNRTYANFEENIVHTSGHISIPFSVVEKKEIMSFDIWLKYDDTAIKYVGLNKSEQLSKFQIFENKQTKGVVRIGGFSLQFINANGLLLEALFEAIAPKGQSSEVELVSFRLNAEPEQKAIAKVLVSEADDLGAIDEYALYENYPNPFNPETTIKYQLPVNSMVRLQIYNMIGQEVRMLLNEQKPAGEYHIQWDGKNDSGEQLPSGMYLYRLISNNFVSTKKMSLVR